MTEFVKLLTPTMICGERVNNGHIRQCVSVG